MQGTRLIAGVSHPGALDCHRGQGWGAGEVRQGEMSWREGLGRALGFLGKEQGVTRAWIPSLMVLQGQATGSQLLQDSHPRLGRSWADPRGTRTIQQIKPNAAEDSWFRL